MNIGERNVARQGTISSWQPRLPNAISIPAMKTYELDRAPPSLHAMVEEMRAGEEILITEHQKPVAKLVSLANATRVRPRAGSLPGEVWMSSDFNAPLADLKDYMQ